ncbi:hypothetical protein [Cognatiyoonia sp. IB215182]|uniref:hypothetical protein n=1 Tax=Cognatiyoonia sp. IB215182 TaxID=3097353 RepID=UPI002A13BDF6|nr:hypothetical protein [Cognatiyoonia sp. IB215182]MDX8351415.1 hypothetical protein [Cognatiyoonia sp. IB215182]
MTLQATQTPTPGQTEDVTAFHAAIAQQAEASATILERLSDFETKLSAYQDRLAASLPDTAEQLSQIRAHLQDDQSTAELLDAIAATQNEKSRDDAPDLTLMLAKIAETVSECLNDNQQSGASEGYLAQLSELLTQMQSDLTGTLRALLPENDTEAAEPLTQAAFAEMLTALPNADDLNERLSGLSAQIVALRENADATNSHQDNHLAAQLDQLAKQISALGTRPDPTLDLTDQRQMLARFQTAMGHVVGRLENEVTRIEAIGGDERQSETAATQLSSLAQALTDQFAPLTTMPSQLTEIATQLQGLPESQNEMSAALKVLKDRPAPTIDLTEQRKSLAQFAGAIGTAIKRLEAVTERIEANDDDQDFNAAIQRIEDVVLSQATENMKPDEDQSLAPLHDAIGLLQSDISTLLDRPAPVPDMSLQRTSLARFTTAMGTMLTRLERVADQIETSETEPLTAPDEIDNIPDKPTNGTEINPFADAKISFDNLRLSFAELIAQQIMDEKLRDGAHPLVAGHQDP